MLTSHCFGLQTFSQIAKTAAWHTGLAYGTPDLMVTAHVIVLFFMHSHMQPLGSLGLGIPAPQDAVAQILGGGCGKGLSTQAAIFGN